MKKNKKIFMAFLALSSVTKAEPKNFQMNNQFESIPVTQLTNNDYGRLVRFISANKLNLNSINDLNEGVVVIDGENKNLILPKSNKLNSTGIEYETIDLKTLEILSRGPSTVITSG